MSKVNAPNFVLSKIPFSAPSYKTHLERILEQLYLRSGGGVSGIESLDQLTSSAIQTTNDTLTQTQTDLGTAESTIDALSISLTSALDRITTLETENADQANSIDSLETLTTTQQAEIDALDVRLTALEP